MSITSFFCLLPTARSEFITVHFSISGKTSNAESATTMGKCEFVVLALPIDINSHIIMNLKCSLCSNWAHLVWKRWCHTVTSVRLCHQFPVQVHPVLPSRSQATFKPSSFQVWHWKRRCSGFWTLCVCVCVCVWQRAHCHLAMYTWHHALWTDCDFNNCTDTLRRATALYWRIAQYILAHCFLHICMDMFTVFIECLFGGQPSVNWCGGVRCVYRILVNVIWSGYVFFLCQWM